MNQDINILIVDDNRGFIERMAGLLGDMNRVHIRSANTYDEAILEMADRKNDLVLLDISLPGKSGISLLKEIKALYRTCEVIMISNFSGDYYRDKCKKLGALGFLDKTGEFDKVPLLIAEAVQ